MSYRLTKWYESVTRGTLRERDPSGSKINLQKRITLQKRSLIVIRNINPQHTLDKHQLYSLHNFNHRRNRKLRRINSDNTTRIRPLPHRRRNVLRINLHLKEDIVMSSYVCSVLPNIESVERYLSIENETVVADKVLSYTR